MYGGVFEPQKSGIKALNLHLLINRVTVFGGALEARQGPLVAQRGKSLKADMKRSAVCDQYYLAFSRVFDVPCNFDHDGNRATFYRIDTDGFNSNSPTLEAQQHHILQRPLLNIHIRFRALA